MIDLAAFMLREPEPEPGAIGSLTLECCDEFFIPQQAVENKHLLLGMARLLTPTHAGWQ